MIDSLLNLMFRCSHKRLTRPVTPVARAGAPHGETYVVCLDCGKQFSYDARQMRIGKALPRSHDTGVLPPDPPRQSGQGMKYALWASVPVALVAGVLLRDKNPRKREPEPKPEESKPSSTGAGKTDN